MHGTIDPMEEARRHAYSIPLDQFDPGHPELFRTDTFWPYFDRLRKEDPVHYCAERPGPHPHRPGIGHRGAAWTGCDAGRRRDRRASLKRP